jgi:DNA polymerase III epsilon subunit-like protein
MPLGKYNLLSKEVNKIDNESIKENKMWYKSIPEILNWLKEKSKMPWILLDTETTGLGGPKNEQLTQISAIVCQYDFKTNTFKELAQFDEKIKLTSYTKAKYNEPGDRTKWVLGFNRYGSGGYKYQEEQETIDRFFEFISEYEPCLLVAQNAQFDMQMLGGRYGHKIKNEVFDTKMLIQLYFLPLLQKLAETDTKYKEMIDFIGRSPRDNGLISSSMSKIGPVLNVNMQGYHDALTDCRLMMQMYQKMIDILKQNSRKDVMKYQIERIKSIRTK